MTRRRNVLPLQQCKGMLTRSSASVSCTWKGIAPKEKTEVQRLFEARRLLGLAAAQGNANAQWRLGCMHLEGHGGS